MEHGNTVCKKILELSKYSCTLAVLKTKYSNQYVYPIKKSHKQRSVKFFLKAILEMVQ